MTRKPKDTKSDAGIVVTGPQLGRRRIGRDFGPEPVRIPLEDLSEDDMVALIADPSLSVTTEDAAAG